MKYTQKPAVGGRVTRPRGAERQGFKLVSMSKTCAPSKSYDALLEALGPIDELVKKMEVQALLNQVWASARTSESLSNVSYYQGLTDSLRVSLIDKLQKEVSKACRKSNLQESRFRANVIMSDITPHEKSASLTIFFLVNDLERGIVCAAFYAMYNTNLKNV